MDDLLISFYGDDFTGSTDVMESLTFAGLRAVLFLDPPTAEQVAALGDVRAIGVAGRTRSMRPEFAEIELRPVFDAFRALGTPIVHYKTCSTLDSAPGIGSIGRAIDVGYDVFRPDYVPLVVGAPILRRYCAFGNLFASSGLDGEVFRLDRHPTMSRHPTTPMDEADVRLHLGHQTEKRIGLVDVTQLDAAADRIDDLVAEGYEVILLDTMSDDDLRKVGRALWDRRGSASFVAGSSGAEYALVAHWRAIGEIVDSPVPSVGSVSQIVVASGSCSPVTAEQIAWAESEGFELVSLAAEEVVADCGHAEIERGVARACEAVAQGKSVVIHTGRGPEDPRIGRTLDVLKATGMTEEEARSQTAERIGSALGDVLRQTVDRTGLKRVATTGGDTSYYVAKQMGVTALEAVAPLAPGSPLCKVHSTVPAVDGCEVTFKGGQVGKVGFFGQVLAGK
jgi:uncharacterized protein YgbK (DUF1537 family)